MSQYKFIWQSKLSKKKKIENYIALVFSKGTWGFHLLALGKTDFQKIEREHLRCLRRILRIPAAFVSRISNDTVLKRAAVPTACAIIRRKQFQLFGHILRLDQDDPDWRVCFQPNTICSPVLPPGQHKRKGRPRLRWAETLFDVCKHKYPNMTRQDIYNLAQDRKRWRMATWSLSLS